MASSENTKCKLFHFLPLGMQSMPETALHSFQIYCDIAFELEGQLENLRKRADGKVMSEKLLPLYEATKNSILAHEKIIGKKLLHPPCYIYVSPLFSSLMVFISEEAQRTQKYGHNLIVHMLESSVWKRLLENEEPGIQIIELIRYCYFLEHLNNEKNYFILGVLYSTSDGAPIPISSDNLGNPRCMVLDKFLHNNEEYVKTILADKVHESGIREEKLQEISTIIHAVLKRNNAEMARRIYTYINSEPMKRGVLLIEVRRNSLESMWQPLTKEFETLLQLSNCSSPHDKTLEYIKSHTKDKFVVTVRDINKVAITSVQFMTTIKQILGVMSEEEAAYFVRVQKKKNNLK